MGVVSEYTRSIKCWGPVAPTGITPPTPGIMSFNGSAKSSGISSLWNHYRNSPPVPPIEDEDPAVTIAVEDDIDHETPLLSRNTDSRRLSLVGSYRRPSFTFGSSRPTLLASSPIPTGLSFLNRTEIGQMDAEEQELLKDNHILPSDYGTVSARRRTDLTPPNGNNEGVFDPEDERAALVPEWNKAVENGLVHTTYKREAKVLVKYAVPLYVTFVLQYSLTFASLFSAGNLGKNELAAVTLASMTANITGYAIYQGTGMAIFVTIRGVYVLTICMRRLEYVVRYPLPASVRIWK